MCLLSYPLGSYKNWQIIHCIDTIKQHKTTSTKINDNIKQNGTRNIDLNIGKEISDNDYGAIYTIEKYINWILSC